MVVSSRTTGHRIIDAHTHLFPAEIVANRSPHVERDAWFGELYASPAITMVTPEDLIASMNQAGIAMSVVCGWPWRDQALCREHNAFLADVASRYADRIAWLAIVNPLDPDAPQEIERCVAAGARGVGELNADAQGFTWDATQGLTASVEACQALDLPMLMHCSEPVGHAYPGKGTATPERILRFLDAFREIRVVAAHWGGGLPFYEMMPEVAELTRNVVYDSAASTYLYRFDVFPVIQRLIGADRIAFATDYPLLRQSAFIKRVLGSGLPDEALRGILGATASRVFGLEHDR
jgi:predicted TIM-barrel fold metal-dependent hydrolase